TQNERAPMTLRAAFAALTLAVGLGVSGARPALAQTSIVALSERDEAAYRDAFAALEAGNWRAATAAAARAEDDVLEGVVRGRMLLSSGYRAGWNEYTAWLNRHGEYGMANAVYDRAMDSRSRRARRNGVRAPAPVRGGA